MASTRNIQKITAAMKMVAASRLRGVQTKTEMSRGISYPVSKLFGDDPDFLDSTTTIVPITSDKGLCGGINTSVVKYTRILGQLADEANSSLKVFVIGEKGRSQLRRTELGSRISDVVLDSSKTGVTWSSSALITDEVLNVSGQKTQIIFNRYYSAISFKPTIATVLYEKGSVANNEGSCLADEYEIEGPDRGELMLDLAEFQTCAVLFNALLENQCSELGSRMQAMENSSKNAGEMLNKYTLLYNRTRQAAITTELIEIISGASALEG